MAQTRRKPVDWKAVEGEFRSGSMSNRRIAEWYGISEGAVRKRAKAENWVRSGTQDAPCEPVEELIAPHVPASAPLDAGDIINAGRSLVERLLGELDAVTLHRGELEDMIVAHTAGDRDGRRRAAMLKAVALPTNANVLKALASAAKTLGEVKQGNASADAEDQVDAPVAEPDDGLGAYLQ